jgi:YVTN family beta-propeller protein
VFAVTVGVAVGRLITTVRLQSAAAPGATVAARASLGAQISVGGRPGAIATTPGAIWVADITGGRLTEIDTRSAAVVGSIDVGVSASYVAYGEGSLWVSDELANVVQRVDPQRRTIIATIPTAQGPYGIVVAAGSVWVTHLSGVVSRIDPQSNGVIATIALARGGLAQRAAFGAGSIWVTASADAAVYRIDPTTNAAVKIDVGEGPLGVAFGDSAVWIGHRDRNDAGKVSKIDPQTNAVIATVDVDRAPNGIVVDRGSVWVACQFADSVLQIDAATVRVIGQPIKVGKGPAGLAFADGALWVAQNGAGTVGRIPIP